MKLITLANSLILLIFIPAAGHAQQQKPEVFANRFYQSYFKLNVRGLPDEKELKLLSPYLDEELRKLFEKMQLEQQRFIAENSVEMKPPWVDGDMFTSLFEGAQSFQIGTVKTRGVYTDVSVDLEYKEKGRNVAMD